MSAALIKVNAVTKRFGGRTVLDRVSFVANAGETVGLIGPNGSGKTTLLRIAGDELTADAGAVERSPGLRLGLLPQGYANLGDVTVGEAFSALVAGGWEEQRLASLAERLAEARDTEEAARLAVGYEAALDRLEGLSNGGVNAQWGELGLRAVDPDQSIAALSGGELSKFGLLNLVAMRPDALLLDEPTNNLDLAALEWLDDYLDSFSGPIVIVSHDRALLDARVDRIVELDAGSGRAETFVGNYASYAEEKARRESELWDRYRRQRREERHLRRVISNAESRGRTLERRFVRAATNRPSLKLARRAVTLRARLERQLHSAERADRPEKKPHGVRGQFELDGEGGARLVSAQGVTLEIAGRRLLEDASFDVSRGERVFLIGPNGRGKTTLLRALLGEHPVTAGRLHVGPSVTLGYLAQEEREGDGEDGDGRLTPVDLLRQARPMAEDEANNLLHRFLFSREQVLTPIARLSYGERRRLALARFVVQGTSLLLLDEPTNHLDVPSREAFEASLQEFEGAALIVTHDRYFIERFADVVLAIEGGRLVRL